MAQTSTSERIAAPVDRGGRRGRRAVALATSSADKASATTWGWTAVEIRGVCA